MVFLKSGRWFVHNIDTKLSKWNPPEEAQDLIDKIDSDEIIVRIARARGLKVDPDVTIGVDISEKHNAETSGEETTNNAREIIPPSRKIVIEDAPEEEEQVEYASSSEEEQEESTSSPGENLDWLNEIEEDDDEEDKLLDFEKKRIFFEMLESHTDVNPYNEWDIELSKVVDDERYDILDSGKQRKDTFDEWAKQKISILKSQKTSDTSKESKDVSIILFNEIIISDFIQAYVKYLEFIAKNYKTKYYFVDMKRKFKKNQDFATNSIPNDEKESLFRTLSLSMQ